MVDIDKIATLIDLTLLDPQAREQDLNALIVKAAQYQVAAICVLPQHLDFIPSSSSITRATVVNFPSGNEPHHHVIQTIQNIATQQCVHEIDYVFPYQTYLHGDAAVALSSCAKAYQCAKQHGLLFKVILETGALPSVETVYQLSGEVINSGCDFLKTSTGKIATGATIPAVTAMLSAILDSKKTCGIKISGGVKTIEQATDYIQLAQNIMGYAVDKQWFRIGASSLLDLLIHHR